MADNILTIVHKIRDNDHLNIYTRDPMAQFGDFISSLYYLGTAYLPDLVSQRGNEYTEEDINFRVVAADDSEQYGTPQAKGRTEHTYLKVEFGNIDALRRLEAWQIDALNRILKRDGEEAATIQLTQFLRNLGEFALKDKRELKRWECLRNGYGIYRTSGNIERQEGHYSPPSTHRFDSPIDISNPAENPLEVIELAVQVLRDAGYAAESMVSRDRVKRGLANNPNTKESASHLTVTSSLELAYNKIRNPDKYLDPYLSSSELPPLITYDAFTFTQKEQKWYLEDDELFVFGRTPRKYPIIHPQQGRLLTFNSLGYFGIGECQNQTTAGDVIKLKVHDDGKPDYVEVISDSMSGPVIQDPEAVVVVKKLFG
ncbi:MAG: hypothetical protein AB4372_37040 [Xenococcus sp. (in: cyanobacteria)]